MPTDFYDRLTPLRSFAALSDQTAYAPLPDDWVVGTTDIVDSTGEIAKGRYKTVNMIGASAVASLMNTLDGGAFPFVFGGDGASFAVPGTQAQAVERAMSDLRHWARDEFDITLRAATIRVADLRAQGKDLSVARFAVSDGLDYAMFSGGGLAWLDAQMKNGNCAVPDAGAGRLPDLTGLSCRWNNLPAQNGLILSLVVVPGGSQTAFQQVTRDILDCVGHLNREGHPVPIQGPGLRYPPPGLSLEARVSRRGGSLALRTVQLWLSNLFAWTLFTSGIGLGDFDPKKYRSEISPNSDFRKFDDGLKMTLDCDTQTRDTLLAILQKASDRGDIRFGHFEQDEAMVTCIVPSVMQSDHIHFVDGAAGGYAQAAARLKQAG